MLFYIYFLLHSCSPLVNKLSCVPDPLSWAEQTRRHSGPCPGQSFNECGILPQRPARGYRTNCGTRAPRKGTPGWAQPAAWPDCLSLQRFHCRMDTQAVLCLLGRETLLQRQVLYKNKNILPENIRIYFFSGQELSLSREPQRTMSSHHQGDLSSHKQCC